MIVLDLIELLKTYPPNAPVAHTFDSIAWFIEPDDVYLSASGVLLIGDDYKDEFISGELSA